MEKDRARDMEIFYAFCRLMDDIADDESSPLEERKESLKWWKEEIGRVYSGGSLCPLGEEMRGLVKRRNISKSDLLEIIDGVERDTNPEPFETFEDIKKYCHGVACAVGLVSICIFGCKNPRTKEYAEALGYALQFTNILRDVRDDLLSHDRVYIPSDEMRAFGVSKSDLNGSGEKTLALFKMMWFRAKHFFNKADRLLPDDDRKALAPALIMRNIYGAILDSIYRLNFEIPPYPLKISKPRKILLALSAIRDSKRKKGERKFGKAAVFGAGISGTCAALKLALEGFDVTMYESSSHPMGRASSFEWSGIRLDNGSHALMGCYANFFRYCKILNTLDEENFAPLKSLEFIFSTAKTTKIVSFSKNVIKRAFSALEYLKIAGFRGNLSLLLSLKFGLAHPQKDETAREFLMRKKIPESSVKTFWEPFCISALNTPIDKTNASLLVSTLKKSSLKGGKNGDIIFPESSISESFYPRAKIFLESVGAKIKFSETLKTFSLENGKIVGFSTSKNESEKCDWAVSALPPKSISSVLKNSGIKPDFDADKLSRNDILNVYFTSEKRLIEGKAACIIGSPFHWLIDHTSKCQKCDRRIYGITVSALNFSEASPMQNDDVKKELFRIFGEFEIGDMMIGRFSGATIGADFTSESNRPGVRTELPNLFRVGDWIQTGLPCTMESAAKSAEELPF